MKKKLLVTVLAAAMVLSMTACGGENADAGAAGVAGNAENQVAENAPDEKSGAGDEVSEENAWANSDSPYWLLHQDFSAPQKEFEGTLFNDSAVLPLDLVAIDEYAAPYCWDLIYEEENVSTINEILTSERILNDDLGSTPFGYLCTAITTQEDYVLPATDDKFCGIEKIMIVNPSDTNGTPEDLSVKTCYENGWWYIDGYEKYEVTKLLQIEGADIVHDMDHSLILDNVVEKFGVPTYIAPYKDVESLEKWYAFLGDEWDTAQGEGYNSYYLIYEYDDFTLVLDVNEGVFSGNHALQVVAVAYMPDTMWEIFKEDFNLFPVN